MNFEIYYTLGSLYIVDLTSGKTVRVYINYTYMDRKKLCVEDVWSRPSQGLIRRCPTFGQAVEICGAYLDDGSYILNYPSSIG